MDNMGSELGGPSKAQRSRRRKQSDPTRSLPKDQEHTNGPSGAWLKKAESLDRKNDLGYLCWKKERASRAEERRKKGEIGPGELQATEWEARRAKTAEPKEVGGNAEAHGSQDLTDLGQKSDVKEPKFVEESKQETKPDTLRWLKRGLRAKRPGFG